MNRADLLPSTPPFDESHVAVNVVNWLPPFEAGELKLTEMDALAAVAPTRTGAPGTVAGVTVLDAAEASPWPTPFVAVTEHV